MRTTRRRVSIVPILLLAGCAAPASGDVYEGRYSWGYEESVFEPCGNDERWWVVNDSELVSRYRPLTEREYEQVYVRLRGTVSVPGSYGQGGPYPREIEITGVLAERERREDDYQ